MGSKGIAKNSTGAIDSTYSGQFHILRSIYGYVSCTCISTVVLRSNFLLSTQWIFRQLSQPARGISRPCFDLRINGQHRSASILITPPPSILAHSQGCLLMKFLRLAQARYYPPSQLGSLRKALVTRNKESRSMYSD